MAAVERGPHRRVGDGVALLAQDGELGGGVVGHRQSPQRKRLITLSLAIPRDVGAPRLMFWTGALACPY